MWVLTFVLAIEIVGLLHGVRQNVALNKESRQSTTYHDRNLTGIAALANDGDTYQHYEITNVKVFCSHTLVNQQEQWWAVDLGQTYNINSVTIYNRIDHKPERLANIYILVYNPMVHT
ncbi:uncharacterized protein LOC134695539 [Mytilus trossulus]|uniref:uncharacterized protein LOC134695539 n=1 Tax=Mytilus trossulus TaxID=6551 RepID=UPI00300631EA